MVCERDRHFITATLGPILPQKQVQDIENTINRLPLISVHWKVKMQEGPSHSGKGLWSKARESIALPRDSECVLEAVFEKHSLLSSQVS